MKPRLLLPFSVALLGATLTAFATVQELNWTAGSGDIVSAGNWRNLSNQTADPTNSSLIFGLTPEFTVDLSANLTVNSLLFTGDHPAYVFNSTNSSVLSLSNGITLAASGIQPVTFQSGFGIELTSDQTWELNNTLIVSGPITGSFGITKIGTGKLTLSGANTFTGGVSVSAGSLYVGASSSEGSGPLGTGTLTLGNGTTLAATSTGRTLSNQIVLGGSSVTLGNASDQRDLTLGGEFQVSGASTVIHLVSGTFTRLTGGLGTNRDGSSSLTFDSGGGVLIDGTGENETSSLISSITSDNSAVVFATSSDLPATSVAAVNNGYIGMADGFTSDPTQLLGLITAPGSFAGTIGFDTDSDDPINEFSGVINLSSFGNNGFRGIGSLTKAIITTGAVLTAPANGILQISGLSGGSLRVNAPLTTANGVTSLLIGRTDGRGDGTVILTNNSNNYTGGTTLQSGRLYVGNNNALGTGTLTIPSGAITPVFGPSTSVTIANNIQINHTGLQLGNSNSSSLTLSLDGVISGNNANVTVANGHDFRFGGNNTFGGGLTVQNGSTAQINSNSGAGTGKLQLDDGTVYFNTANPVIGGLASSDGGVDDFIHLSANGIQLTINQSANTTFSALIKGDSEYQNGGIIKQGTGTLTLSALNEYYGSTTIQGGLIAISNLANGGANSGLGRSSNSAANLVLNGAGLRYNGSTNASTNRLFTLGTDGGGLTSDGTGSVSFTNTGSIALTGTNTARTFKLAGSNTGGNRLASILTDNGTGRTSLVKDGAGIWSLTGANTYTGSTWIKGGTLSVGSTSLSNLTAVIVEAGAYLESHDVSIALGSIAGAGTIKMAGPSSGTVNLTTGADNTSTTFSGVIQELDHANSLGLVKSGTGILTLSGANIYGAGTTVTGGMLVAGHNNALGSGSITLNGGGIGVASGVVLTNPLIFSGPTTVLGGNGTFGTHITANSSVVLSPGNSPGTLTFNAGLTLASGSAISFQIQNAAGAAGTGYDLISVTGGVLNLTAPTNTITFNIVSLNNDGNNGNALNFSPGQTYSWTFANSPNANITGFNAAQFNLVLGEFTNALNGGRFSISQGLDQRSLLLNFTPVPEPSTWLLLGSGLGALALRLRRRRS